MVKLCTTCRHYHADKTSVAYDYCSHPDLKRPDDLVRGEPTTTYCQLARENAERCGREAIRWEAK